jgi:hypothetical protein
MKSECDESIETTKVFESEAKEKIKNLDLKSIIQIKKMANLNLHKIFI